MAAKPSEELVLASYSNVVEVPIEAMREISAVFLVVIPRRGPAKLNVILLSGHGSSGNEQNSCD